MATESYYKKKILDALKKVGYQYLNIDSAASATGKKPFDTILIRNGKCMAIEFKKDYRELEAHQRLSLANVDAAAIIIRVMAARKKDAQEIMVNYPSGTLVFSTPLRYKKFAAKFNLTFGIYFIKDKLSKYTIHKGAMDGFKK